DAGQQGAPELVGAERVARTGRSQPGAGDGVGVAAHPEQRAGDRGPHEQHEHAEPGPGRQVDSAQEVPHGLPLSRAAVPRRGSSSPAAESMSMLTVTNTAAAISTPACTTA